MRLSAAQNHHTFKDFNSHTPHGVRLGDTPFDATSAKFQLTHPTRGATSAIGTEFALKSISTHTPHTGCDSIAFAMGMNAENFNSHTPHGVRPS